MRTCLLIPLIDLIEASAHRLIDKTTAVFYGLHVYSLLNTGSLYNAIPGI